MRGWRQHGNLTTPTSCGTAAARAQRKLRRDGGHTLGRASAPLRRRAHLPVTLQAAGQACRLATAAFCWCGVAAGDLAPPANARRKGLRAKFCSTTHTKKGGRRAEKRLWFWHVSCAPAGLSRLGTLCPSSLCLLSSSASLLCFSYVPTLLRLRRVTPIFLHAAYRRITSPTAGRRPEDDA